MNQFDYAKSAAIANRLLKKFGQTGAIRRISLSSGVGGNPWDPESPTTVNHPCTLAMLPINLQDAVGRRRDAMPATSASPSLSRG